MPSHQQKGPFRFESWRSYQTSLTLYKISWERPLHSPDMIGRLRIKLSRFVREPSKIVPYYRLSLSTWPLSNNKELFCHFRRVKPGKSHTTGLLICAKPTRRRDQSTTLHHIEVHKLNIITNQVFFRT
jgi:hypothetical protein